MKLWQSPWCVQRVAESFLREEQPCVSLPTLTACIRGFISRVNGFSTGVEFHFIDACGCEHDFSALKCME